MLLTEAKTDDGSQRVYFTRQSSVVSFFEEDADGNLCAHAHLSEFACPWSHTSEKIETVRMAMLAETARRLCVRVDQVVQMTLADVVNVSDAPLKFKHTWIGRAKTRGRSAR